MDRQQNHWTSNTYPSPPLPQAGFTGFYPQVQNIQNFQNTQHFLGNGVPHFQGLSEDINSHDAQQLQRWANWVKFVAAFMAIKAILSIISVGFQMTFAQNASEMDLLSQVLFVLILFFVVGLIGYRVGNRKSAAGAKFYIFCILTYVVVEGLWIVNFTGDVVKSVCRESDVRTEGQSESKCFDEIYTTACTFIGIGYILVSLGVCAPVIWCPYKMYKHAKAVERFNTRRLQNMSGETGHFQVFGFHPVLGTPVS
jgi:hypothetical protein